MSKVDDELTRRLHEVERPVDGDDLFEGLQRRRTHRERLRRVQAGLVAFAVLAATAGGFAILRDAFGSDERDVGQTPPLPANGEIVFVKDGDDSRQHIYAAQPDGSGERQITEGSANDSNPAVSPDGRTVAFAHHLVERNLEVIATVPIEGGPITWQTSEYVDVSDPTWSPDGTQIAFIDSISGELNIAEVNGNQVRQIDLPAAAGWDSDSLGDILARHPSWSPDGNWIAVEATVQTDVPTGSDIAVVRTDGTALEWIVQTNEVDELAPAWSPDGTKIAFLRAYGGLEEIETTGTHEIWTIAPDGGAETLIASAGERSLRIGVAWAPDATSLLVSDGTWISRVDPSPRDPEDNFVRLVQGYSPSWQPLPAGSDLSSTPTLEPSISPEPEPAGHDIGLEFRLCHLHPLGGIDFLGDGTEGKAWTGTKVLDDGTCPNSYDDRYGVAADFSGDGVADSWSGDTIVSCVGCEPFKAMDLNGDGRDELIVIQSYFSIMQYGIYTVILVDGQPQVIPFTTGEPGHSQHSLDAGQPFTFWAGGDAGSADWFYCDTLPEFRLTGTESPIDGGPDAETTVHETHVSLGTDGIAHILDAQTYTVVGEVDLQYATSKPDCGLGVDIWRLPAGG
jgi:Tol biopolymer transport system component